MPKQKNKNALLSSPYLLFFLITSIFIFLVFSISYLKQINPAPLLAGLSLGMINPTLTFILFKKAKKLETYTAFKINFFGIVLRFIIPLLVLIFLFLKTMTDKKQLEFFVYFCYSFLCVHFLYIPLEIYVLKKIGNY